MNTKYILVKKSDFTNEMLNRSISTSKDHLPIYVSTSYLLWLFPVDTEFYIVEFDEEQTKFTNVFDSYLWYSSEGISEIINNLN